MSIVDIDACDNTTGFRMTRFFSCSNCLKDCSFVSYVSGRQNGKGMVLPTKTEREGNRFIYLVQTIEM